MTLTRALQLTWNRTDAAAIDRIKRYCVEDWGVTPERMAQRQREIDALPVVIWKGRTLRTIRCVGDFGKGPHDMNVPESHLWSLISLERMRCPFHS